MCFSCTLALQYNLCHSTLCPPTSPRIVLVVTFFYVIVIVSSDGRLNAMLNWKREYVTPGHILCHNPGEALLLLFSIVSHKTRKSLFEKKKELYSNSNLVGVDYTTHMYTKLFPASGTNCICAYTHNDKMPFSTINFSGFMPTPRVCHGSVRSIHRLFITLSMKFFFGVFNIHTKMLDDKLKIYGILTILNRIHILQTFELARVLRPVVLKILVKKITYID